MSSIKTPFREFHLFSILNEYDESRLPLDLFLSFYFRKHRAVGSKDRKEICENIYGMIRWRGLLDHLCKNPSSWKERYEKYSSIDPLKFLKAKNIPQHIRLSFPKELFERISSAYGEEEARKICLDSNYPAPTTIRVNKLKTSRKSLLNSWKEKYVVSPCKVSDTAITFHKKINFFASPEFKEGLFEIQDEGSQLVAHMVQAQPGQSIMDYCSGSGGKTLAFAPGMENKGQIFLHDIRPHILQESRRRLRRAGIQNAQTVASDSPKLKTLKKRMDWVLVDAPCSGSGTIRRNPDMKWKYDRNSVAELVGLQRVIFEKALSYLKPEGKIVYATCSIYPEENEAQVEHFLKTYSLEIVGEVFKSLPQREGMDGFFACTFKKKPLPA
jgi:16S rRNA (cytosine967-C5)-methyltransferase